MMDGGGERCRISRLVRTLSRAESEEVFLETIASIQTQLTLAENRKYVQKSFSPLATTLVDAFKIISSGIGWRTSGVAALASLLLSFADAMEESSKRLYQWLFDIITKRSRNSRGGPHSVLIAVHDVLFHMMGEMDESSKDILNAIIQNTIEDVDSTLAFQIISSVFVATLSPTTTTNHPFFHDFVDVVIGWMVDETAQEDQCGFCSKLLLLLQPHFQNEPSFPRTLLNQIVEDIEAALKGISSHTPSVAVKRIFLLSKAFNAMLKTDCFPGKEFLIECCERMIGAALKVLNGVRPCPNTRDYMVSLMLVVSETLYLFPSLNGPFTRTFIKTQLGCLKTDWQSWPGVVLDEFWCGICSWTEAVVSATHLSEDTECTCQSMMDLADEMEVGGQGRKSLSLVQSLLRTRNVSLLQKVYQWHIDKLSKTAINETDLKQRKLFVVAGLSDIAVNRSGSILSLWALQPSIAKLLMDMSDLEEEVDLKMAVLNLLRSHCIIHSHFLSCIATTGSFSSDSPGGRFLPSLMDFWIKELEKQKSTKGTNLSGNGNEWLWEWLEEFLEASSSYASLLRDANPQFFDSLLNILIQLIANNEQGLEPTRRKAKELCLWLVRDPNYCTLELVEEKCLEVLLKQSLSLQSKNGFLEILANSPVFIISLKPLPSTVPNAIGSCEEDILKLLTPTQFKIFLFQLLNSSLEEEVNRRKDEITTSAEVNSAVNHLIEMKLRTPLGKPQEFFGKIQAMFKKRGNDGFPRWKLNFMFQLERAFLHAIHGSCVLENTLPETVRSFYVTNKSPCIEWLKRMRSDLIEVAFDLGDFSMAFYNASVSLDRQKAAVSLFHLHDGEGLKGLDELAGWHYVQGNLEEALKLLSTSGSESSENTLRELIEKRAASILSSFDPAINTTSGEITEVKPLLPLIPRTLFDFQVVHINEVDNNSKTSLRLFTPEDELSLWNLLTLRSVIKNHCDLKSLFESVKSLQQITLERMMEHGNTTIVKHWLDSLEIPWKLDQDSTDNKNSLTCSLTFGRTIGDISLLENKPWQAAQIYERLIRTDNVDAVVSESELFSKSQALVNMASKMREYPTLCQAVVEEVPYIHYESKDTGSGKKMLQYLYLKALDVYPSNKGAWVAYGNFHYELAQDKEEFEFEKGGIKRGSVESYTNYLETIGIGGEGGDLQITKVISRLLSLYEEGYEFDPEKVMLSHHWLHFLPQIAQMPSLRIHMLQRFPDETSLFLSSYDSTDSGWNAPFKRKGLFEPMAFGLTEVSDEAFTSTMSTSSNSSSCACVPNRESFYALRSPLNIPEEIRLLGKELLRVGTSLEDVWSWNLQRVLLDWNKRIGALKRDMARDPHPLKVQLYLQPVIKFLEELWAWSEQTAESPAELGFITKHGEILQGFFKRLSNCTSAEAIVGSFEKLLLHVDTFDSFIGYKSSLAQLSPKLARFHEICGSEGRKVCLPGMPPSTSLVSIEPVVIALATKTKPKKIKARASNGKCYEYLVKGNENLNVDAAVMQFLTLTSKITHFPTWTYSVTPLGKRGGLIQMVEDALALFLLYKKYLQRNNCFERTTDMFWRRMNSLGSSDRSNVAHLKDTFNSLCDETSTELISRELLLCAKDVNGWYSSVQMFTRDMGLSSAVGYTLGIGDRHLDNILVDLHQGKLIHVDFSLMFDKGKSLRVPECVPFRLTQNFSKALQFPGVQGAYSVHLENTLNKFEQEKELILCATKNISFACQLVEDPPISLGVLLPAEINSALGIFKFRKNNIWKTAQATKNEIVQKRSELENHRVNLSECKKRVEICERNIEGLTVALSLLKEAQIDSSKLSPLRSRCYSSRVEHFDNVSGAENILAFHTENFLKKSVATENDVQWANSLEKVICSQLQNEIQIKLTQSEEECQVEKGVSELKGTLQRRLNRWKRILANVDPLIQFICSHIKDDGRLCSFKAFGDTHWIPHVAHFWLHSTLQQLLGASDQFLTQFEMAETTLEEMFLCLDAALMDGEVIDEDELLEIDPVLDTVQQSRVEALVNSTRNKIQGFNSTVSVGKLIEEATSVDNLAQMYEGWTPWV